TGVVVACTMDERTGVPGAVSGPPVLTEAWRYVQGLDCCGTPKEDWYVAQCLEVEVARQGTGVHDALHNLTDVVGPHLEEADDPKPTMTPLVTSFQVPGAA
ncbi:MAG: hypothetical protein ACRDQB_02415, partial [Thermocrispum sp.]